MKTAISIPDRIYLAAERAAKRQKVSRSRFYAQAVEAYLKTQQAKGVTEALNAVYGTGTPVDGKACHRSRGEWLTIDPPQSWF
jgi:predicted transcriptional regulator